MEKKNVTFSAKWRGKLFLTIPTYGRLWIKFLYCILRLFRILCSNFFSCSFNNEWTMSISFVGFKLNHIRELFKNFSEVEYCAQPKGWVCLGLTWLNCTWLDLNLHYLTWHDLIWLDMNWLDLTPRDRTLQYLTKLNLTSLPYLS